MKKIKYYISILILIIMGVVPLSLLGSSNIYAADTIASSTTSSGSTDNTIYQQSYTNSNTNIALGNKISYSTLLVLFIIFVLLAIFYIVTYWKIFTKAGVAGWKSIIPIYNQWTMLKIIGYNPWLFITLIIPLVQIVPLLFVSFRLAKVFGKSKVFGFFGLYLFSFVGYPILAFGKATYTNPNSNPLNNEPIYPIQNV